MVYGRIRPYTKELLQYCSQFCEVVVFTASVPEYADKIIDFIDPERQFIHKRLYRESCTFINRNYVKDLNRLGRPLVSNAKSVRQNEVRYDRQERTIIVDNSVACFGYHISNGIPIRAWYSDWEDRELYNLATCIRVMASLDDVRPMIENIFNLKEVVENINIQE